VHAQKNQLLGVYAIAYSVVRVFYESAKNGASCFGNSAQLGFFDARVLRIFTPNFGIRSILAIFGARNSRATCLGTQIDF
jgi:hypothetical protein